MSDPIRTFQTNFNQLNRETLHLVDVIYHREIQFADPIHEIEGIEPLREYFRDLYENVVYCQFDFATPIVSGNSAAIPWIMHLEHGKLRKGERVAVPGISHIEHDTHLVTYHRDYFDLGKMLYERIPVLGSAVRAIKNRL